MKSDSATVLSMIFPYEEFDLSGVHTYPLASRKSKANVDRLRARRCRRAAPSRSFLDALPNVLAAADLNAIVAAMVDARQRGGGVLWGIGAHVIKTGLAPVLIDLMERGFVSASRPTAPR